MPEKDTLIAAFARLGEALERIAVQDAHIAALEARVNELTRPAKNPGNSSKPPSEGQKTNLPVRPVRLKGTENRHKAIQKSHAKVGLPNGLGPAGHNGVWWGPALTPRRRAPSP